MGLDITAYRQLKPAPQADLDGDGDPKEWDKFVRFTDGTLRFTEEHWLGRSRPIVAGVYGFADSLSFRAGSYSGYNEWRNWLARISGWGSAQRCWERKTDGPFAELIDFADNEGIIGTEVAAKLANDFVEFEKRAEQDGEGWAFRLYGVWRKAFEMAAEGGAVKFH